MGLISVFVQDEQGIEISERVDLPTSIIPQLDDTRFLCLRFIDPYGDTVFNRLQIHPVLEELRLLKTAIRNHEHLGLIQRVEALGDMCQKEPHLYLKFIGD